MRNVDEVNAVLTRVVAGLEGGTMDVKIASELNNACGKAIRLRLAQLEYHALRKDVPTIAFFNEATT